MNGDGIVGFEESPRRFRKHRRAERPERLAELDARVQRVLHVGAARIGEDAAAPERARAELHAPLEPADDLAVGDRARRAVDQFGLAEPLERDAAAPARVVSRRSPELRAVVDVPHDEVPRLLQHLVPDVQRGANRGAGIVRGRLNVDVLERRPLEDHAVGDAVQGHAACEADRLSARSAVHVVQEREDSIPRAPAAPMRPDRRDGGAVAPRHARGAEHLDHLLRVDGAESWARRPPTSSRRRRCGGRSSRGSAGPDRPVRDHVAHLVGEARLAVGRQAHHLVFVAVLRKAEKLGERGVEQPQRMREVDAARGRRADCRGRRPTSRC